ncbi:MAG: Asp-tRNA(Asn)/Glu-tRNA(Gln) amidotransferase subunit GatA [Bacteroidota bacterium]
MYNYSKLIKSYAYCKASIYEDPSILAIVVKSFLKNIESKHDLNAFVRVYEEEVLRKTDELIFKLKEGHAGELAGLVVGIKDMFCYKDHPVQAASGILKGFVSQIHATVIARLISKDAIIIGHQNCDEFGMGSSTENSIYGPTHNALDRSRVAGGSSGGSAVSLQAGMCHVSLGTDTGGSVRQPAAFTGLIGLKPTYSLVPRDGVIAYASSFDTVGVLAHDIEDCAKVLHSIAGKSDYDNTSYSGLVPDYRQHLRWGRKARVAYLKQALDGEALQVEVRENTQSLLEQLGGEGHEVTGVDFPLLAYALPTYYILSTAEASANLARYEGIRYGDGVGGNMDGSVKQMCKNIRKGGFGKEVQRRILLGTFVLSSSYYQAYYVRAQKVRRMIKEGLKAILAEFDFIVLPTTPTTAFLHERSQDDPSTEYLADLYTVLASIAGLPAISLPNGKDRRGLPVGVQLIGSAFKEVDLLAFSRYILDVNEG